MTIQDQIITALATAAAGIVTALATWAVTWINRKVHENEEANRGIAAQSSANGGSMAQLGIKVDGLHSVINGGQLPSIIEMGVSNSKAVQTLMDLTQRNTKAIEELRELAAGLCRCGAAGKSHAPGGQHCPDHADGTGSGPGTTEGVVGSI